ncbi:MAG: right-handed parallel beta-helix repeat-containing protein [Candidatus Thorarchaeota archaeon]
MKITIYKFGSRYTPHTPITLDCEGEGTKANPIIIRPIDSIPKDFIVRGIKYNIVLKGFKSRYILVENCKNLLLVDTELNRLRMERCSKITIKNLTCLSRLTLYRCKACNIEESFIARLRLFKSSNNLIKNNFIIRLKEVASKNNQLEQNDVRKIQISKSLNYYWTENNWRCACMFTGFLLFIIIFAFSIVMVENYKLRILIGSIPLTMLGILLVACIVVIIYMGIVRHILNKYNERLINEEKSKVGIVAEHPKPEVGKKPEVISERIYRKRDGRRSKKIELAYMGLFELDDEIIKEFNIPGSGTEKDPYIISSTENLPQDINIYKSKYYLKFSHCDLRSHFLGFDLSQNIVVENCELDYCEIGDPGYCYNIQFINCRFEDGLTISKSSNIKLENCDVAGIRLTECYDNTLIKCTINELIIKNSRANTFKTCTIPAELLEDENINPPVRKYTLYTYVYSFIPIAFITAFLFLGFDIGFYSAFLFIGILGIVFCSFLFGFSYFMDKRSKKKAGPYIKGKFDRRTIAALPPNKVI